MAITSTCSRDGLAAPAGFRLVRLSEQPDWLDTLVAQQWQVWGYDNPDELRQFFAQELADSRPALPKTLLLLDVSKLDAGQLVAAVTLSDHEMGDAQPPMRNPWLGYLYVEPAYRGLGLAKYLCEYALQLAASLGYPHSYLYASDEAPRYRHWGWQPLETLTFQDEIVTVMTKSAQ